MQLIKEWQVDLSICGLFNEDLWETSDFLVGIVCLKLSSILMGVFCGLIRHQSRKLTQVDYNCYWSKLDTPISWHTQFDEIDQIFEIKRFVRFVVAARFVLWFFFSWSLQFHLTVLTMYRNFFGIEVGSLKMPNYPERRETGGNKDFNNG